MRIHKWHMPPNSWGALKLLKLIILFLVLFLNVCHATDVFCGQLTIFKQQWFRKDTLTLGARTSTDLKDCLNFCCGIPDCQAVTFMGFLKNSAVPTANCVMFQCGPSGKCQTVTEPVATDGVVSVVIKRTPERLQSRDEEAANMLNSSSVSNQTITDPPAQNVTSNDENTPAPTIVFGEENKDEDDGTRTTADNVTTKIFTTKSSITTVSGIHKARGTPRITTTQSVFPSSTEATTLLSDFMPIWVVGILIVITVVCAGTCLILLSVWMCVRRSKTKMRSQPITSLKTPTLHAFNPTSTNLNTTSTMA